MTTALQHDFEVLVIGGGPAGLAAAARAAESGARVGIVDDGLTLGGQIWRGEVDKPASEATKWAERLRRSSVMVFCGWRVVDQPACGILLAESLDGVCELKYEKLVLATGARERFLPFPGWTLPNVMGAGGLQAMVKCGLPVSGKRVVVAGTGPLLLAVAGYLRKRGAEILLICEQASTGSLVRFGLALVAWPEKILQAVQLKKELSGVRFGTSSWPVSAHGRNTLESVSIARAGRVESVHCDYLACGFHLIPNIELALLMGCATIDGFVQVDDFQETTVPSVFCAGEPTSIGGVDSALVEGQIAGLAASGRTTEARQLFGRRRSARRFARLLDHTFHMRPELRNLPLPETMVCRCEDVSYGLLQACTSWRAAKLHTRCGMGPCQGRICGAATKFLFGWEPDSVRPPVYPARVETLARPVAQTRT